MDNDGKNEVIVFMNKEVFRRKLAVLRKFSSGHIASLSWNNLGLTPNRRTPKVSGYISDCAIGDFDHDGTDEVVAAHVAKQGTMITAARSSILAYELTQPLPVH